MENINVQLKSGVVTLKKPNAGGRNRALIAGEIPGIGVKWTSVWINLLPEAVVTHPFPKDVPIKDSLDNLEQEEYDMLQTELKKFYKDDKEVQEAMLGESMEPSGMKYSPQTDGSETN